MQSRIYGERGFFDAARDSLLALGSSDSYMQSVSQQHRVQEKRKRRKAYLKRKKSVTKAARPRPAKTKSKKQPPASPE
jgi:hypothetical protein